MSSSAFRIHTNHVKSTSLCRPPSLKQAHAAPHQQVALDLTITGRPSLGLNQETSQIHLSSGLVFNLINKWHPLSWIELRSPQS